MNFVCAVRCSDCCSIFQLKERHEAGITFLHRHGESKQTVWSRLVIGGGSARPAHARQGKMDISLTHNPNSKFTVGAVSEEHKTCNVGQVQLRRKTLHYFLSQRLHEDLMITHHLSET